ncbi:MAG: alpha/beta fold hydrolase [Actinobacteria bacterium]|jgi:pimeloyl-ACP methyl ester carboxylesterase|nr:alpha/beta fold hydrolase [Micrococcales bacterium]MCB0903252.1 alpha/beta fold hydrolase [Actinomycetota bacterium]MCO5298986.1 alpha/beta hydrolase [Candidatus Nanopelagicales bacterium]HPE11895.1 alpha/beta hydrolase [Actinomycetota bacterium]HPJ18190.1 alpha/beta hydrolase [Actinomycetota bacterium]
MTQVVLLHAFPVNRHLWDAQVEYLTKAGFKVTAPDIAGFGESRIPQDPSMALMAEQVLSHVSRPAVFAGLSMGGYLLMEILRQAPDIVTGAIFMDTKASADTAAAREQRLRVAGEVLAADHTRDLADAMLPNLLGATTIAQRPEVVQTVRGWIEQAPPEAVASAQRAMADRPDSAPTLRNYEGPAVVLWGDEDVISPTADQKAMLEMMPQAVARQIPRAGHLSAVEDPGAVNDVLLEVLTDWA